MFRRETVQIDIFNDLSSSFNDDDPSSLPFHFFSILIKLFQFFSKWFAEYLIISRLFNNHIHIIIHLKTDIVDAHFASPPPPLAEQILSILFNKKQLKKSLSQVHNESPTSFFLCSSDDDSIFIQKNCDHRGFWQTSKFSSS